MKSKKDKEKQQNIMKKNEMNKIQLVQNHWNEITTELQSLLIRN